MTFADESATWTSAGALGLAALFLALGIVLFWRWRHAAAREIAAVQESASRTEHLVGEIHAALAEAREEGRRIALVGELGGTLDLDAALRRALQAVSELTGGDGAMIVLRQEEGEPITAAFGLSEEESSRELIGLPPDGGRARAARLSYLYSAEEGEPITAAFGLSEEESSRELIGLPPDGGRARAVRLSYLYTAEEAANDEFRLCGGLAVPLLGESEGRIGTLAIFWRRVERALSDSELEQFEELSRVFGPALENARLFSEARRLTDTDHPTGLHNARYFDERLRREIARARRYDRRLGLLVFDLEQGGGADLGAAGERIQAAVRATDIASHLGEGRFAVILPEAAEADAERLHRRLQFALGGRVDSGPDGVRVHAGLVELRADEEAASFLERAEAALERANQATADRLSAAQ
jgi:diguanylate cyclase (GGDEF)-like protein